MPQVRNSNTATAHDQGLAWKTDSIDAFEKTKGYLDQSVVWVMPTRGSYPAHALASFLQIAWPMNQAHTHLVQVIGMEVGDAYERLFRLATDQEFCAVECGDAAYAEFVGKMNFVLTTEEDNVIPPNAVEELFSAIYTCPDCAEQIQFDSWTCKNGHRGYDAIGGLYWTKSFPPRPMAYGDPSDPDDFRPVSVTDAIQNRKVIEVNGVAMGCTLWRKALFRDVQSPWFKTGNGMTQDLYFCKKAKAEAGARFGVHCGVRVGHIDVKTGVRF